MDELRIGGASSGWYTETGYHDVSVPFLVKTCLPPPHGDT